MNNGNMITLAIEDVLKWLGGFAAVVAVAWAPVQCTMNRHDAVAEAIKAGADPLEAKCALESQTGADNVCLVIAAKKGVVAHDQAK